MFIILSAITCGIYDLSWFHSVAKDANEMYKDDGKHTHGLLMFLLLSLITCSIYSFIWWYKLSNRIAEDATKRGAKPAITGGGFLLWTFVGSLLCGLGPLIAFHKVCKGLNESASFYNMKSATPAAPYGYAPQQPYGAPQQPYGYAPQQPYGAPQQPYGAPQQPYGAPQQPYGAPQQPYGAPQQPYGYAPQQPYGAPQQPYGAPQQPQYAPQQPQQEAPAQEAPTQEAPQNSDTDNQ